MTFRFTRVFENYPTRGGGLGEFSKVMKTFDYVSGLHNCLELSCKGKKPVRLTYKMCAKLRNIKLNASFSQSLRRYFFLCLKIAFFHFICLTLSYDVTD